MLCVQFLFWYIAHKWNYGILATPARTIVKNRLNVLLRYRNCSEAFPVWTGALSVIQFATLTSDLKKTHLPKRGSVAISAPIKVFRLDSDRFKNLSDKERSTFNSEAEQYCSGAETASKAAFLVRTEALSGTFCDGPFHYTVRCEHSLRA